jgi:hypothetical protein
MRAKVLAVAIAALIGLTATATARANGLAMITIDNPTPNTVHYQFKWGDNGDWVSYDLAPHTYRNHWHTLNDVDRAPAPFVRFDCILNDGEVTYQTYHLEFHATYNTGYNQGKVYVFKLNYPFLDLKELLR